MVFRLPPPDQSIPHMLQRAGYSEFRDPNTGDTSFVRRLGTYFYPRFHLYITVRSDIVIYNLHLDQKQPSYAGASKHNGEYEGATVTAEGERLEKILRDQSGEAEPLKSL